MKQAVWLAMNRIKAMSMMAAGLFLRCGNLGLSEVPVPARGRFRARDVKCLHYGHQNRYFEPLPR